MALRNRAPGLLLVAIGLTVVGCSAAPRQEAGQAAGAVPFYTPVPVEGDASTTDIGYAGRLRLSGGCIRLVPETGQGDGTLLIFPRGRAQWREPGVSLAIDGTLYRDGDRFSSGGSETVREFWTQFPAAYRDHAPIPAACSGSRYLLVSGPIGRG